MSWGYKMIWNKEAECMSDDDRKEVQLEKLQSAVKYVY